MNRLALTAVLVAASLPAATRAFADASFDRTLATSSAPNLDVRDGAGRVLVHAGTDRQVHVVATLRPQHDGDSEALARIAKIVAAPPIVQAGNDLKIGVDGNDPLYRNIVINYDVAVPVGAALAASTGSGDVEIKDCGASLVANTGSGNLKAHGVSGPAKLGTGSGEIDLAHTGSGDIVAQTGSGTITVVGVGAGLDAHTGSGDIHATGALASGWQLKTGSGDVVLDVARAAKFSLEAETGSGEVHVDQPMTDQQLSRHHLRGVVNGGGSQLHIKTGSGDIHIKAV